MSKTKRPIIKFKLLNKNAKIPAYSHKGDAAFDIYSTESIGIEPGQYKVVKTGLATKIQPGWFVSFRDRSGLAAKLGIHVIAGVIDSGYRGEWGVVLVNLGKSIYKIEQGERIAQGILQPAPQAEIVEVDRLPSSDRGEKGFGSTGKK
jgi:dUTP pyrophosphatase